jgi:hypothetical protein
VVGLGLQGKANGALTGSADGKFFAANDCYVVIRSMAFMRDPVNACDESHVAGKKRRTHSARRSGP